MLDRVYHTGEPYAAIGASYTPHGMDEGIEQSLLDFVYQPIKDDAGAVSAILVVGVDVTDRAVADVISQRLASMVKIALRRRHCRQGFGKA